MSYLIEIVALDERSVSRARVCMRFYLRVPYQIGLVAGQGLGKDCQDILGRGLINAVRVMRDRSLCVVV